MQFSYSKPAALDDYDRREQFRTAIELPLRISAFEEPGGVRVFSATCTDFSEKGLAFESFADLQIGQVVLLELLIAGDCLNHDRSLIQIVHREEATYGARFVKPSGS
jgi:hypothetical protein